MNKLPSLTRKNQSDLRAEGLDGEFLVKNKIKNCISCLSRLESILSIKADRAVVQEAEAHPS